MRIYVSGPAELHAETVARLNDNGMTVVNTKRPVEDPASVWAPWPPADQFRALVNADAIYMGQGWSMLERAVFERAVATHLGLRIYGARA